MKQKLFRPIILLLLSISFMLIAPSQIYAAFIFLKNGTIIECELLSQNKTNIVIKDAEGSIKRFVVSKVLRMSFADLDKRLKHVRLVNGRILDVYRVAATSKYEIFRKELQNSREIKVLKSKIASIVNKYPVSITAKADFTSITIMLKPALASIKTYRIYIKQKGGSYSKTSYKNTSDDEYTFDGLNSSTDYCFKATVVDEKNTESLPGKELCLALKNYQPQPVKDLKYFYAIEYKNSKGQKRVRASIHWQAAADRDGVITRYEVFIRNKKSKKFDLYKTLPIDKRSKPQKKYFLVLSGLLDNTEYQVKVVAFDDRNITAAAYEAFSTTNSKPAPPVSVTVKQVVAKSGITDYMVSWPIAHDIDGKVVYYEVLIKKGSGYKVIAKTKKLQYRLSGRMIDAASDVTVRAIDNRGGISDNAVSKKLLGWYVSVQGLFLLPFGSMAESIGSGYGGLFNVMRNYTLFDWLHVGVTGGYFLFAGSHEACSSYSMLPVLLDIEHMQSFDRLLLSVSVSGGMSYNSVTYNDAYTGLLNPDGVLIDDNKGWQPLMLAGVRLKYTFSNKFYIQAAVNYAMIFEKSRRLHFLAAGLAMGYNIY